tara:strand:+ start:1798 stop:2289 length:492 start_codon:yes stop_codon:yes gene_type:complete
MIDNNPKNVDTNELSPFTGNMSVVKEIAENGVETRICMDTGFTTSNEYTIGSDKVEEYEKTTAKLVKSLKHMDTNLNQFWYPTTVMFSTGMIYPEGNEEDWEWVYSPIITMNEEESKQYPIPGKPGEYYQTRLGVDVSERYSKSDFREVCKRVGIAKEVEVNE